MFLSQRVLRTAFDIVPQNPTTLWSLFQSARTEHYPRYTYTANLWYVLISLHKLRQVICPRPWFQNKELVSIHHSQPLVRFSIPYDTIVIGKHLDWFSKIYVLVHYLSFLHIGLKNLKHGWITAVVIYINHADAKAQMILYPLSNIIMVIPASSTDG